MWIPVTDAASQLDNVYTSASPGMDTKANRTALKGLPPVLASTSSVGSGMDTGDEATWASLLLYYTHASSLDLLPRRISHPAAFR